MTPTQELIEGLRSLDCISPDSATVDHLINAIADRLAEQEAEIDRLRKERDDLQQNFNMRWETTQRAIKDWQAKNPGKDMIWPDTHDLMMALLAERDTQEAEIARLRKVLEQIAAGCVYPPAWGIARAAVEPKQ